MWPEEKLQRIFENSAMVRTWPVNTPHRCPLAQGLNGLTRALQKLNLRFAITSTRKKHGPAQPPLRAVWDNRTPARPDRAAAARRQAALLPGRLRPDRSTQHKT